MRRPDLSKAAQKAESCMETKKFLDIWTAEKIMAESLLTRQDIENYTEGKLREILGYAAENSLFYKEKLAAYLPAELLHKTPDKDTKESVNVPDEEFWRLFRTLSFTTPQELRSRGAEFLCVSPGEISRIVTLNTGGSTGEPKRVYFTPEDQQLTVDYFENGMQLIVDSTDKVLILMPAKVPGSIGKLLAEGIENFGAKTIAYGLPFIQEEEKQQWESGDSEVMKLLKLIRDERITSVVALPTHMRALAQAVVKMSAGNNVKTADMKIPSAGSDGWSVRSASGDDDIHMQSDGAIRLRSVLLSAEYVSDEAVNLIEKVFGCKVYEHYGMTEMGLGCAVSCGQGEGYHIREADIYIEIIDPETGENIEDDRRGELVFTTLTRKGMPFIRYRTGDYSRWITEECSCGSLLKRIAKVESRKEMKGYLI